MSIEQNLDIVRQRFDAWQRGDFDALSETHHPDVELIPDPSWPEAGTYRGDEAVRGFYEAYRDRWDATESVDYELIPAGDKVLARWRNPVTGRQSGAGVETQATSVFTLRDGKVVRIEYFFDHDEALRAAGLRTS
jgi:ketosteroid isomerase-like protein